MFVEDIASKLVMLTMIVMFGTEIIMFNIIMILFCILVVTFSIMIIMQLSEMNN